MITEANAIKAINATNVMNVTTVINQVSYGSSFFGRWVNVTGNLILSESTNVRDNIGRLGSAHCTNRFFEEERFCPLYNESVLCTKPSALCCAHANREHFAKLVLKGANRGCL